jgi:hypothetical protein
MPTVTVYFLGICTHVVERSGSEIDNVRVVLVNASFGMNIGGDPKGAIPPHSALIYIPAPFISSTAGTMDGLAATGVPGVFAMKGVSLDIAGVPPPDGPNHPIAEENYLRMPRLSVVAADNGITQPLEVDRRTVDEGGSACVFTIKKGRLDALIHCQAVHGKVTFTTEGPAELRIVRMWDRATTHITLQRGAIDAEGQDHDPVIIIANVGTDDDKNIDFLLHYGTTTLTPRHTLIVPQLTDIPVRRAKPDEARMLDISPIKNWTITHGCSNSIYP